MHLFHREPPEARFWKWFQANSKRLHAMDFEQIDERLFNELRGQLQKVHRGLTFEFGPVKDGKGEFIVSADGVRDLFPAVERLVAAAPSLPEWTIIAFRPAKGTSLALTFGGRKLDADDIWFTAQRDGAKTGLNLYIRGFTGKKDDPLYNGTMILLDAALGEYIVETRIGFIEWHPLPIDPVAAGLKPFRSLPDIPL